MATANTLSEKFIQDKAIKYLAKYYKRSSANGKVFAQAEVRTREKKRADGLIAWRQLSGGVGVASMEAKSAKTLSALVKQIDEGKIKKDSTWLTVVLVFLAAYILWDQGLRAYFDPFWVLVLYGVLFFLLPYIQRMLQGIRLPFHQRFAVLAQLQQYPSNEPWVAIGTDSVNSKQYELLKRACRKKRLGLLLVQKSGRVTKETSPRYSFAFPKKDFLVYYEKGAEIRKGVKKGSNWKIWTILGTSAQLRSTVSHFGLALAGFIAIYAAINFDLSTNTSAKEKQEETQEVPPNKDAFDFLDTLRDKMKPETDTAQAQAEVDCDESILGPKYIIQDRLFDNKRAAQQRVATLKAAGFEDSDYLWLPCYENEIGATSYCVYPYFPRTSQENALEQLRDYLSIGMEKDLSVEQAQILLIELK